MFSGEIYESLAKFLKRGGQAAASSQSEATIKLDIALYSLSVSGPKIHEAKSGQTEVPELHRAMSSLQSDSVDDDVQALLVFLQGHQSPECLSSIGSICNVHPVFFQQHLEDRSSFGLRQLFSAPSLPSAFHSIVRLKLMTVGVRNSTSDSTSQSLIDGLRMADQSAMDRYLHSVNLEHGLHGGDSIVRSFNVHDATYYSIEQEVTIRVQRSGRKWLSASNISQVFILHQPSRKRD